jgi:hypothetical protein
MLLKNIIFIGILVILYLFAWSFSMRGYGYAGYSSYRDSSGNYRYGGGPSFFYWGGTSQYYGNSGSLRSSGSGPGYRGGGPSVGK